MSCLAQQQRYRAILGIWAAAAVASLATPALAGSQIQTAPQSLDEIVPTIAPAFIFLDVEPTSIQRPTSPKALKTALLSIIPTDAVLPQNFAVEVTPYWLRPRRTMTLDDYFSRDPWRRLARTSSIALASKGDEAEQESDAAATTRVAGSYRVMLYSPGMPRIINELQTALGNCTVLATPTDPGATERCLNELRPRIDSARNLIKYPPGLHVEFAVGASMSAAADGSAPTWQRRGAWLTPTYTVSPTVDFIGVVRYLRERPAEDGAEDIGMWDYGARLLWRPTDAIGLSGELLGRSYDADVEDDRRVRYGALFEYRVAQQFYLFYSVGKDFAASDAPRSALFSRVGLNVGFGPRQLVSLARAAGSP